MRKPYFGTINSTIPRALQHTQNIRIFGIKDHTLECFLLAVSVQSATQDVRSHEPSLLQSATFCRKPTLRQLCFLDRRTPPRCRIAQLQIVMLPLGVHLCLLFPGKEKITRVVL